MGARVGTGGCCGATKFALKKLPCTLAQSTVLCCVQLHLGRALKRVELGRDLLRSSNLARVWECVVPCNLVQSIALCFGCVWMGGVDGCVNG